jgi:hypothetical protein
VPSSLTMFSVLPILSTATASRRSGMRTVAASQLGPRSAVPDPPSMVAGPRRILVPPPSWPQTASVPSYPDFLRHVDAQAADGKRFAGLGGAVLTGIGDMLQLGRPGSGQSSIRLQGLVPPHINVEERWRSLWNGVVLPRRRIQVETLTGLVGIGLSGFGRHSSDLPLSSAQGGISFGRCCHTPRSPTSQLER